YLAPEALTWKNLDMTYSDFINFCLSGDLNKFYDKQRWTGWKKEVEKLSGHRDISFTHIYGPLKEVTLITTNVASYQ
ncbi:MAG: hypothetical protein JWP44_3758, partial [Mucilaginibacter sp.]|nr:hypothetical protein [Mucilaginibacter sp.]